MPLSAFAEQGDIYVGDVDLSGLGWGNQTADIELENKTKIKAVEISWEQASAKDYKIQVSNNKNKWKDVAKIENAPGGEKKLITFDPVETKYVRMYGEKRNGEWGYSIWEIKVYK